MWHESEPIFHKKGDIEVTVLMTVYLIVVGNEFFELLFFGGEGLDQSDVLESLHCEKNIAVVHIPVAVCPSCLVL